MIYTSAIDLARAIREKQISSLAVVEAYLAQIERTNPTINAIITLDADGARAQAKFADAALARGEVWGGLHGVPFTLKDSHSTKGMRTTSGYPPLADYVPEFDSTVAQRLKAAGAILMGKTNVSELLWDIQSKNDLFGVTNNPYHHDRTAGGSSGGAGAAIAAGMTPFDIGSDIGGSIRIPAHFNGIFGLKPTENRVSEYGHIPDLPDTPRTVRSMSSIGPMARTVDDLVLLFRLIAGADGHDTEVPPVPIGQMPDLALSDLRIAIAPTFGDYPVNYATQTAIEQLATQLVPHCASAEIAPMPDIDYDRDSLSLPASLAMKAHHDNTITLAQYMDSLHRRDTFIRAWEAFFDDWDALICPTAMTPAFPHHESETPFYVAGIEQPYWMMNAHCKMFNYTGHPAVAMPYTRDTDGLPLGIQVVGKRWEEMRLLGIAKALTQITGEFTPPNV